MSLLFGKSIMMKHVLAFCLTLPLLLQARKTDSFEKKGGNVNGPDFDNLPDKANIPDHAKAKFIENAGVKKGWVPKFQRIPKGAPSFVIGGETVWMDELHPMGGVLHPDATVTVGGVVQPPEVNIYTSVSSPTLRVLIDKHDRSVIRVVRLEANGDVIDVLRVEDDVFAEIDSYKDLEFPGETALDVVSPVPTTVPTVAVLASFPVTLTFVELLCNDTGCGPTG